MSVSSKEIYDAVYALMPNKSGVIHSGAFVYEVATHLGLSSPDELGTFASGKPKMSSFVNNALKKMCGEGIAHKIGRGKYKYGANPVPVAPTPTPVVNPQPVVAPVVAPQVMTEDVIDKTFGKLKAPSEMVIVQEVKEQLEQGVVPTQPVEVAQPVEKVEIAQPVESEYLYDIRCPSTVAFLASITPCWAKHKASDSECQKCPLANQCENAKLELKRLKDEAKEAEAKQVAKLEAVGVSGIPQPDPNADLEGALRINTVVSTHCVVSGDTLSEGSEVVFVPNWGTLKPSIAEAMGINP